ncbi:polysaccharide pyruvyl transferase family protein [Pseudaquabacterium pictum]|uniref:GumL protein n=1 Tax=Pseudaquabacterium pictum TaxID=2315236 RepID=A0A480APL4_9BURK|nr:polysaccharide pyruvyl transferase family protein [Rubrivivax pictus]GCL63484.1 GumL protein [Rubrivivax pictus]
MTAIELFHYDPRLPVVPGRLGSRLPWRRPLSNFGDLLGPVVVRGLLARHGVHLPAQAPPARADGPPRQRLLSIGSVLHYARDGDVVWGSGRNAKMEDALHRFTRLDVRAVRGPLTRDFLLARGVPCPPVYGDPGLLVPLVLPELVALSRQRPHPLTIVPNYNDLGWMPPSDALLDPRSPWMDCLRRIAQSALVVATSLHAVVVAEALGVPARLVRSRAEHPFKYQDYYLGTGRSDVRIADSLAQALRWGGEPPPSPAIGPLLDSFPHELWTAAAAAPPGGSVHLGAEGAA